MSASKFLCCEFRGICGKTRLQYRFFSRFSFNSCNAATVKMKGYLASPLNGLGGGPGPPEWFSIHTLLARADEHFCLE
jgi:hypothetical protein